MYAVRLNIQPRQIKELKMIMHVVIPSVLATVISFLGKWWRCQQMARTLHKQRHKKFFLIFLHAVQLLTNGIMAVK